MTQLREQRGSQVGARASARASRLKHRRPFPWFKYLTLAPLLVLCAVFVAYPLFTLVKNSLGEVHLVEDVLTYKFTGLDNYAKMLDDAVFPVAIINSVVFIAGSVLGSVILGVAMAFITDRVVRGKAFFQNILIWPAVLAPVVVSVLWLLILSPQLGLINKTLGAFGLDAQVWLGEPVGAMASVIFVDIWHWTPIVYLLIYTALRAIDESILEAASVDGASYIRIIRSILLPLLTPAIVGVIAVRIIMGVKVFDEMFLLTFGGPGISTTIISLYIRTVFFDRLDFGYGSALSITVIALVLIVLILILSARSFLARIRHD